MLLQFGRGLACKRGDRVFLHYVKEYVDHFALFVCVLNEIFSQVQLHKLCTVCDRIIVTRRTVIEPLTEFAGDSYSCTPIFYNKVR